MQTCLENWETKQNQCFMFSSVVVSSNYKRIVDSAADAAPMKLSGSDRFHV